GFASCVAVVGDRFPALAVSFSEWDEWFSSIRLPGFSLKVFWKESSTSALDGLFGDFWNRSTLDVNKAV
ncbi:hypothetical protein Tco_1239609, partial [Tanacetum coccineum]